MNQGPHNGTDPKKQPSRQPPSTGTSMFPSRSLTERVASSANSSRAPASASSNTVLSIKASRETEVALRLALLKALSDLYIALKREGVSNLPKTWIDLFMEMAPLKFPRSETPLCNVAQVYLYPRFLHGNHQDRQKSAAMVKYVEQFFRGLTNDSNRDLRAFAQELIKRQQNEESPKAVEVAGGKAPRTIDDALARFQDESSSNIALAAMCNALPGILDSTFRSIRRATTEGEKARLIDTLGKVLQASTENNGYHNMSRDAQRTFKDTVNASQRRLDTLKFRDGSSGQKGQSK